ncbi:MAG TPA: MFS transporter [Streptosporangiaceae bacterium]|nr:MFS transporter [Streptosporangiaceae bacterium]
MGAAASWRKVRDTTHRAAAAAGSAARPAARTSGSAARWTGMLIHRGTRASGAGRTGLSELIELTAVGSAGDAFIAVALAGTLFFHASPNAARGQVALYLLVTMAPFAVLAPFIGPMLDRLRTGRRYILAGTMLGRGLLCWGMAGAILHRDPLTLLPSAFAVLVLSKAYGITRSAVTPRLLPAEITLVTANARCGLASLIAAAIAAPIAAGISVLIHAGWVLRFGTLIFLVGAALSIKLPDHVDTAGAPAAAPAGARARAAKRPPAESRRTRTLRSVGPVVGEAMRANAAVRAFSGFMVMFLAFLLRADHFHGVNQNVALGALVIAATAGGLAGTAAGSSLRSRMPHLIMFGTIAVSTIVTAVCAWFFGLAAALIVALVAAFGQALAKLSLDSIVQREIGEEIRSSTFAVSETLHQLSWVAGGLVGVVLSVTASGTVGLSVAAFALGIALVTLIASRRRRVRTARLAGAQFARADPPTSPSVH